jgi:hypothetical protein
MASAKYRVTPIYLFLTEFGNKERSTVQNSARGDNPGDRCKRKLVTKLHLSCASIALVE